MTLSNTALSSTNASINTLLEAGSAVSYPRISFQTAGDTVLHEIDLPATNPLGTPTNGVSDFAAPQGEASWVDYTMTIGAGVTDQTPAKVVYYNRDNVAVDEHTVSTVAAGTGDWQFSSTTWNTGDEFTFSATPTYTHQNPA